MASRLRILTVLAWAALTLGLPACIPSAVADADDTAGTCPATQPSAPTPSRHINLVLDDSGSMFASGGSGEPDTLRTRWSVAKYSLEVFAAMLGERDLLNVYLMSDFAGRRRATPKVRLTGLETPTERVRKIHDMQLVGGTTPFAPVQEAYNAIKSVDSTNKWLVVLTDGTFDEEGGAEIDVDKRLRGYTKETPALSIDFIAFGDSAATIPDRPDERIYFESAEDSAALMQKMTAISNRIFQRKIITGVAPNSISPDVPLAELLVFAQGRDVVIGGATIPGRDPVQPTSTADVSWTPNQDAAYGSRLVPAKPDESLRGKLAAFTDLPAGPIVLDVEAPNVDLFYKPQVNFGIKLTEASSGQPVALDKIVGGEYRLEYGFMNDQCEFFSSELLEPVETDARIIRGDTVTEFASGDVVSFERGQVELVIQATYLDGYTAEARFPLTVLRPAQETAFEVEERSFPVSRLNSTAAPDDAIKVRYGMANGTQLTVFSDEEWGALTPASFTVTSDANLAFEVELGDEPGVVYLVPRAPGGDILAASTGIIALHLAASHTFDEQLVVGQTDFSFEIEDDVPWQERALDWFAKVGWKLLLALIGLIIVLGYVFKRRFPKSVKRRPTSTFTPKQFGQRSHEGKGRFTVAGSRRFLPFLPDKAVLRYWDTGSGVMGLKALRLKAGPRRTMVVENWKQFTKAGNVSINGQPITAETRRAPTLSASAMITAETPTGTVEMTPSV